ncbi:MAG TPA: YqaJ viral recombinase family protein [Patescibacteria group bacterium]|nr:YqaJ viral recombinase family protein [Patescibacteria group bacterium]
MKTLTFQPTEREEWLYTRRGKITGSRLKDIVVKRGNGKKIGFYELIAEKLGLPPDNDENAMERGARLEKDAIERFKEEAGKDVDTSLIIWARDDNENIAISPDGVISETEAVEAKCLSSARHIEAFLTKKIPAEYEMQALQYFIVNDKLELLHFIFFDPRFAMFSDPTGKRAKIDYFEIPVTRAEVQSQIDDMLTYEREVIAEVNEIVNKLTF